MASVVAAPAFATAFDILFRDFVCKPPGHALVGRPLEWKIFDYPGLFPHKDEYEVFWYAVFADLVHGGSHAHFRV